MAITKRELRDFGDAVMDFIAVIAVPAVIGLAVWGAWKGISYLDKRDAERIEAKCLEVGKMYNETTIYSKPLDRCYFYPNGSKKPVFLPWKSQKLGWAPPSEGVSE